MDKENFDKIGVTPPKKLMQSLKTLKTAKKSKPNPYPGKENVHKSKSSHKRF